MSQYLLSAFGSLDPIHYRQFFSASPHNRCRGLQPPTGLLRAGASIQHQSRLLSGALQHHIIFQLLLCNHNTLMFGNSFEFNYQIFAGLKASEIHKMEYKIHSQILPPTPLTSGKLFEV